MTTDALEEGVETAAPDGSAAPTRNVTASNIAATTADKFFIFFAGADDLYMGPLTLGV